MKNRWMRTIPRSALCAALLAACASATAADTSSTSGSAPTEHGVGPGAGASVNSPRSLSGSDNMGATSNTGTSGTSNLGDWNEPVHDWPEDRAATSGTTASGATAGDKTTTTTTPDATSGSTSGTTGTTDTTGTATQPTTESPTGVIATPTPYPDAGTSGTTTPESGTTAPDTGTTVPDASGTTSSDTSGGMMPPPPPGGTTNIPPDTSGTTGLPPAPNAPYTQPYPDEPYDARSGATGPYGDEGLPPADQPMDSDELVEPADPMDSRSGTTGDDNPERRDDWGSGPSGTTSEPEATGPGSRDWPTEPPTDESPQEAEGDSTF